MLGTSILSYLVIFGGFGMMGTSILEAALFSASPKLTLYRFFSIILSASPKSIISIGIFPFRRFLLPNSSTDDPDDLDLDLDLDFSELDDELDPDLEYEEPLLCTDANEDDDIGLGWQSDSTDLDLDLLECLDDLEVSDFLLGCLFLLGCCWLSSFSNAAPGEEFLRLLPLIFGRGLYRSDSS